MEITQVLWALLSNPNVVYAMLIIGLWAAAAAFYAPGTGALEVAAVICLTLAIAGLTQLPTNVVGVIMIVIAGVLFAVDLKVQSVAITVGAAITLVLGSVFLFPPDENVPQVSPWLIGGVTLGSLGFFGMALFAVARTRQMRAKVSAEEIVGQTGIVTDPLDPTGTVQVQSELWTAVATGDDSSIDAGEEVEIVAVEGLKVCVKRINPTQQERRF